MTPLFAAAMVCIEVMSWNVSKPYEDAFRTCLEVAQGAEAEGLPADLVVALAYTESRLNRHARSSRGAAGPMQVLPRFHCPSGRERGCDLVAAGLSALSRYRNKYKEWPKALCHWNSGNRCYRRSKLFARIVLKRRRAIAAALGD